MYVRKDAVLSSMIEGTESSLSDLLIYELDQEPGVPLDDVREVSNYAAALNHGLQRISENFPLSLRLIKEIHSILLSRGKGNERTPGEFRQNPFLDGNGRLGRLLITLLLCEQKVLRLPMLYLSLYFKTNRRQYYELLTTVRQTGDWEAWLDFFADAVIATATQAEETARHLLECANRDRLLITGLGRPAQSVLHVLSAMMEHPIATSGWLAEKTELTPATVNKSLAHLERLGIVRELRGQKRNRVFSYHEYIDIMNRGTELPN
jgi:Fic family protein